MEEKKLVGDSKWEKCRKLLTWSKEVKSNSLLCQRISTKGTHNCHSDRKHLFKGILYMSAQGKENENALATTRNYVSVIMKVVSLAKNITTVALHRCVFKNCYFIYENAVVIFW